MQPTRKPRRPYFSSGPCAKRPGWSPAVLAGAQLGRSHRAADAKARLVAVIEGTRAILRIPDSHLIAITPASDTGAVEIALWSLLGPRGVDLLAWESFGHGWVRDVVKELGLEDVRVLDAPYGELPDLGAVDFARDVVFCWNGTTSGVRVPDGDWIAQDRQGLTIADATSAAFAMDLPWPKLDVATFSWQKVLGGEAQHGMLVLGPRAVERLESHTPTWPMPKLFRLTKAGQLNRGIFSGSTINTPSMLCVEDMLDALRWAGEIGGLEALIGRSEASLGVITDWVARTGWVAFLGRRGDARSPTSVCLSIVDPWFEALGEAGQRQVTKQMTTMLAAEGVAFDIDGYRDAPPGLRIWCGATVDTEDVALLLPWLDWAYGEVKARAGAAAVA